MTPDRQTELLCKFYESELISELNETRKEFIAKMESAGLPKDAIDEGLRQVDHIQCEMIALYKDHGHLPTEVFNLMADAKLAHFERNL